MPSLPLQSLASTRLFLMNRWTDSLLSCKKRWLRNQADSTVKSQARFHVIKSKWEIVIQLVQVESLILRLASKFPGRRDQLLFLINNYDVVRLKDHIIYKREVWFFIWLGDVHHHRADEGWFEGVWNISGAAQESKWRVRWADAGTALWGAYRVAQKFIAHYGKATVTLKMYSVAHMPHFQVVKRCGKKTGCRRYRGLASRGETGVPYHSELQCRLEEVTRSDQWYSNLFVNFRLSLLKSCFRWNHDLLP